MYMKLHSRLLLNLVEGYYTLLQNTKPNMYSVTDLVNLTRASRNCSPLCMYLSCIIVQPSYSNMCNLSSS